MPPTITFSIDKVDFIMGPTSSAIAVAEDVVWGETMFSDKYGFAKLKNLQAMQMGHSLISGAPGRLP